ncbi:MAG TPA: ComEC/Rec2 family competence protein [Ilumatobacteraceae bacterium]|nr:ComEC/Rec2 family competence protein [Ilumatobacteraceae bacterium]
MYEATNSPGYDAGGLHGLHPRPPVAGDLSVVGVAVVTALAVRTASPRIAIVLAMAAVVVFLAAISMPPGDGPSGRRAGRLVAAMLLTLLVAIPAGLFGAVRSQHSWAALTPDVLGPFSGWVRVVDDPQPYASSTRVIVEVDGERFEVWARGRAQQLRVMQWRGGEWILVEGERVGLDAERAHRVAWQHVVGRFDLEWASDVDPGGAVARASNRVRGTIERAARFVPEPYGSLYRGLVIGDDREQPRDMIDRFRASGLSHLTAVSGQNVAFVLAAFGPLLVRLRPWPRWALTVTVIAWFVVITRFEPSILRAGVMAALAATAFATGRERSTLRILAVAVTVLLLIDPLLAWSVGFWLSVGATAGVCTVGPWLASRFAGLGLLALPLGITLGAQLGVVVPSVMVFGRLPLVSVVANVLAVPVAGFVMLYGLPAGLLAGTIGDAVPWLGSAVMLPARVGTRWVDTIAILGARLEPAPPWNWLGWIGVVAVVLAWLVVGRFRNRGSVR